MSYFVIVVLFFLFTLLHCLSPRSKEKDFTYLYFILIFVIALGIGLRGDNEYSKIYIYAPYLNNFFSMQNYMIFDKGPLFAFIVSLLKTLQLNSQSLLLLFAFVSVFLHAVFFRKFTKYYFLAFLIYLSHEIIFKDFSTIRAGLSSALVLPMIYYIVNRETAKFWWCFLISSCIQFVGLLSVLLLALNRKFKFSFLLFILLLSVASYYLDLSTLILNTLNDAGLLPAVVGNYLSYELYVYDVGLGHFKTIQQTITLLLLLAITHITNKEVANPYYNLLFNTYFLATILMIAFAPLALFAFRFGGHFYSVEPILLTYIIFHFRERKTLAVLASMFTLSLAFLNYIVLEKLEPYKFLVDDYRIFLAF